MKYTVDQCLPQVVIKQGDEHYELHWNTDFSYDACQIIDEQRDYIEGFLDGCYKLLCQNYSLPSRSWGHCAGHVVGISKDIAETLAVLIEELLHGFVRARYDNLVKKACAGKGDRFILVE